MHAKIDMLTGCIQNIKTEAGEFAVQHIGLSQFFTLLDTIMNTYRIRKTNITRI